MNNNHCLLSLLDNKDLYPKPLTFGYCGFVDMLAYGGASCKCVSSKTRFIRCFFFFNCKFLFSHPHRKLWKVPTSLTGWWQRLRYESLTISPSITTTPKTPTPLPNPRSLSSLLLLCHSVVCIIIAQFKIMQKFYMFCLFNVTTSSWYAIMYSKLLWIVTQGLSKVHVCVACALYVLILCHTRASATWCGFGSIAHMKQFKQTPRAIKLFA